MASKNSSPVVINLTSRRIQLLSRFLGIVCILLAIYVIPVDYFVFSVIVIVGILIASILSQKFLVFDEEKIRYPLHWSIKRHEIESYNIDENSNTIFFYLKNGSVKMIKGVNSKFFNTIDTNIKV